MVSPGAAVCDSLELVDQVKHLVLLELGVLFAQFESLHGDYSASVWCGE